MQYAGFWIRLGAYIVDYIVLTIVLIILFFVLMAIGIIDFGPMMEMAQDPSMQSGGEVDPATEAAALEMMKGMGIFYLLAIIVGWLYEAIMVSSSMQATPGKMVFGLRVQTVDGQQVGFGRATGRFLGKIISSLIACIGFLMIAFTERKQGLHDMIAGTLVVRS